MFNIADIVALCIIILLGGWGMKKGFIRSMYALGSLLLSLILAIMLYQPVTNFIDNSTVGVTVRSTIYEMFDKKSEETQTPPEETALNLPQTLTKSFTKVAQDATNAAMASVATSVADIAMKLLGILIVFILVKFILWFVLKVLNVVSKLPILHSANKLLGGGLGIIYGVLAVYLILSLLTLFATFNTFGKAIELVAESKYVSQMYNQNFLLTFLK